MRPGMREVIVGCLSFVAACNGEGGAKEPITIGVIAPKTGADQSFGASMERVAVLAAAEINARGGVNGHRMDVVTVDDMTTAIGGAKVMELIQLGAVAAVGPSASDGVADAVPVVKAMQFPIISPSSTNPALATADDGGFMFRNVPNDSIQGLAMAYYLTKKAMPPVTSVVVVHENTGYGAGLTQSFTSAFQAEGGTVSATIMFEQNLPDQAAGDAVVADIIALNPTMVVLIALEQDGLKIVNGWATSGMLPDLDWFFTDGLRTAGFLAGAPPVLVGSKGTAPTIPTTGQAYGVLANAYDRAHDDDISAQAFAANTWDAVFLIAAALALQETLHPGEPFGGERLRDALTAVSRSPGQIMHAGEWRDIVRSISTDRDVDYDGASGPCDFDADGETIGPYEVWSIGNSGGMLSFERELYLEAQEIQDLIQP